jgi:uncharacterized protein YcbX
MGSGSESGNFVHVRLAALQVYPIKSCAGMALPQALLMDTGIEFDRAWMLVDATGAFLTQRELPRMALIAPTLKTTEMVVRAPGMIALHVALDRVESATRVSVWSDDVAAYDMGDLCAQWFSDFLGQRVRLVRFDPEQQRLADPQCSGGVSAEIAFADAYPLLVTSAASLEELNRRLRAGGHSEVTMARLRPNIVLDGLPAHAEDTLGDLAFATDAGAVRLRLVKPCAQDSILDVDPLTGQIDHAVSRTLATYRADARAHGKVNFGMNAVILEGLERSLRVGGTGVASARIPG